MFYFVAFAPMPHPIPLMLLLSSGTPAYVTMVLAIAVAAGYWQVFVKAGRYGWESLIPGWNLVALARIIGRPWWWTLGLLPGAVSWVACHWMVAQTQSRLFWLLALPGVAFSGWVHVRISFELARSFLCGRRFAWRLALFPFVYVPVLGFGYAEYEGPAGSRVSRRFSRKKKLVSDIGRSGSPSKP